MVSDLRKREHQYLHAGKYHNNLKYKISVHDKLKVLVSCNFFPQTFLSIEN